MVDGLKVCVCVCQDDICTEMQLWLVRGFNVVVVHLK